jgi:prepilin-type N-terminal cleavage/methylation domain-containing protein
MEKLKKSTLKGFTLVELLVVMAIFSILMTAALALTTPVSNMYKNTALSEKTYSLSHNIQEYIQGSLEYADNLYIYTSDELGTEYSTDLYKLAEEYRKSHYDGLVTSDDGSNSRFVRGKIYIMRLMNNADAAKGIPAGQITLREFRFENNQEITSDVTETPMLNSTYFDAGDSNYSFSYALGASKLVGAPVPAGGDSDSYYKALKTDKNNTDIGVTRKNLSISIVLDKDPSRHGYVDVAGANSYRAFKSPVAVQIANLPLTNINSRTGVNPTGVPRVRYNDPTAKDTLRLQKDNTTPPECGEAFRAKFNTKVDFSNDIYFVYSYADELK